MFRILPKPWPTIVLPKIWQQRQVPFRFISRMLVQLLFRTLERRGLMGDPGGVHQDVDLPKAVQNLLLQQLDRRPVAHIHRRAQGAAPQTLNLGSNLLRFFLAAGGSHYIRSCLCNSQGDCLPQTRRTANDNRALTAEIKPAGTQCLLQDANKVG